MKKKTKTVKPLWPIYKKQTFVKKHSYQKVLKVLWSNYKHLRLKWSNYKHLRLMWPNYKEMEEAKSIKDNLKVSHIVVTYKPKKLKSGQDENTPNPIILHFFPHEN